MQQRSGSKDIDPHRWSYAAGGHVGYGSSYQETALSETAEELGITLYEDQLQLISIRQVISPLEREITAFFRVNLTHNLPIIHPDPTEVADFQWVTLTDLAPFVTSHRCCDWTIFALQVAKLL